MMDVAERGDSLNRWGAPVAVQALAQLVDPPFVGTVEERAASVWLAVADVAARQAANPFVLLPEVQHLLQLDSRLPPQYGVPRPAGATVAAAADRTARVARTYEAMTPLIHARASFAQAAQLADDRSRWAIGAPQIRIDTPPPPLLPADGKLWRGRLSKRTDLLMPLGAGLATHETIEIAAEGLVRADGSGFRRYEHFLHHGDEGPGLLKLLEDSGWIELRGSATHLVLRIRKRVTVLLPEDLDARFGAALPLALSTLLWLWAAGFLEQVALADPVPKRPSTTRPVDVPPEVKQVHAQPDGQGGRKARIAVLGGGPAGMASAWLLSNPGGAAWSGPPGEPLSLEVSLVEKARSLGGKAASARLGQPDDLRIQEHGLHVLMGCYRNLLRVLEQVGARDRLVARKGTRIPVVPPDSAATGVTLELEPWPREDNRQPIAQWMQTPRDFPIDLRFVGLDFSLPELWRRRADEAWTKSRPLERMLYRMGLATQQPRPLLRLVVRLWDHIGRVLPLDSPKTVGPAMVQGLALQLLSKRLALAELVAVSHVPPRADAAAPGPQAVALATAATAVPDRLVPLARQLRALARVALPAEAADADVRLAGDLVELATTVAIGLANADLFPNWAIGRIVDPLGAEYTKWARDVQALDVQRLDTWLLGEGAQAGYPARSRLLAAVTAGLFTTPAGIAAGTFVHGLVRLLFTYEDAPYLMLRGGSDHAVVSPILASMAPRVTVQTGREVTSLAFAADGSVTSVTTTADDGADPQTLEVDAAVLAIPPFDGALDNLGLPSALTDALKPIGSVATLSIQHWTQGPAQFPAVIVSGLGGTMRCVAAMDHLQGDEGAGIPRAPVYYCGDTDDATAIAWDTKPPRLGLEWLAAHAGSYQDGASVPEPYVRVNRSASQRYVSADCQTQAARRLVFQTGVPNLWLAGDWTRTTFSCGAIEGAVTSGLEAARHLLWKLGCTVHFPITGPMFDKESA